MTHASKRLTCTQAVSALQQGKLIAYPTESVWGIGCDPLNQDAVNSLLMLKGRSQDKGLILVTSNYQQCLRYTKPLNEYERERFSTHQPNQAISWLMPARDDTPSWLIGKHTSIAIRLCRHPVVMQLCNAFDGCIVSTSANLSGQPAVKTHDELSMIFPQLDYVAGEVLGYSKTSTIQSLDGQCIARP